MQRDFEAFRQQMIEAISLGVPVFSTRCGGPENVTSDSRLGFFCEKDSVDAFSTAMLHILESKASDKSAEITQIGNDFLGDEPIEEPCARVYEGIPTSNVGRS